MFAEALHWLIQLLITQLLLAHYLDDFIAIIPTTQLYLIPEFCSVWDQFTEHLGLLRNPSKDGQGTTLECLGIEIDTVAIVARLPPHKKEKAVHLVSEALAADTLSLSDCEELCGFLNFRSEVVPLGRTFLRRLYSFQTGWRQQRARRPLTHEAAADLHWWRDLLPITTCIRLIDDADRPTFHIFTDASSFGCGAFWYQGEPSECCWAAHLPIPSHQILVGRVPPQHINASETDVVGLALQRWAPLWAHGTLIVHTDNNATLSGILNETLRGAAMDPLRNALLHAAAHDIPSHLSPPRTS